MSRGKQQLPSRVNMEPQAYRDAYCYKGHNEAGFSGEMVDWDPPLKARGPHGVGGRSQA